MELKACNLDIGRFFLLGFRPFKLRCGVWGDCRDLRNRLASNGRDLLLSCFSWALKGVPETGGLGLHARVLRLPGGLRILGF